MGDAHRWACCAGTVPELDLLRTQDELTGAKEVLAQAHYELALADLSLRRAAGTFPNETAHARPFAAQPGNEIVSE